MVKMEIHSKREQGKEKERMKTIEETELKLESPRG